LISWDGIKISFDLAKYEQQIDGKPRVNCQLNNQERDHYLQFIGKYFVKINISDHRTIVIPITRGKASKYCPIVVPEPAIGSIYPKIEANFVNPANKCERERAARRHLIVFHIVPVPDDSKQLVEK